MAMNAALVWGSFTLAANRRHSAAYCPYSPETILVHPTPTAHRRASAYKLQSTTPSNQDAYEPSAVLIEHLAAPSLVVSQGYPNAGDSSRRAVCNPTEVAATASSAQRTACLRHSVGSPGASISRSRTKCSMLPFWRQPLGRVRFDGSSSEERQQIDPAVRPIKILRVAA